MKAQKAAEGLLKRKSFGDSMWYSVACDCGDDTHNHEIWIEADDINVTVNIATVEKTNWWTDAVERRYDIDNFLLQQFDWKWKGVINGFIRRCVLTYKIWVHGYVKYEASIYMSEQVAINYAETLKSAANDVKRFKKARNEQANRS